MTQSEDIPEIKRYLTSSLAILEGQCPLSWWKVHATEYPTLARMARDILSIPLTSVAVERIFSGARDILPYRRNRMSHQMITALMLTKSWDSIHAKYAAPDTENIPAHVEEGLADLDENDVSLERQALRYDTEFLRRMVPVTREEAAGDWDTDSGDDSRTEPGEESEVDDADLADTSSQGSSPFSFSTHSAGAIGNSFQRSLLRDELGTPSPSTPRRGAKRPASPSVHLTPSMATRFQKKLRPTQRRNYKV